MEFIENYLVLQNLQKKQLINSHLVASLQIPFHAQNILYRSNGRRIESREVALNRYRTKNQAFSQIKRSQESQRMTCKNRYTQLKLQLHLELLLAMHFAPFNLNYLLKIWLQSITSLLLMLIRTLPSIIPHHLATNPLKIPFNLSNEIISIPFWLHILLSGSVLSFSSPVRIIYREKFVKGGGSFINLFKAKIIWSNSSKGVEIAAISEREVASSQKSIAAVSAGKSLLMQRVNFSEIIPFSICCHLVYESMSWAVRRVE